MGNERKKRSGAAQGDNESNAPSTLESAESYVTASARSGGACDGGRPSFTESFTTFVHWGEATNLIQKEEQFPFFRRPPDGYGDEHQAWFDEKSNRWFKATYPNRFGLAWGRNGTATAGEYLTRLVLQNQYFGDDIHLVALVECAEKLRVLTSQPHVSGEHALNGEIRLWFVHLGFCRLECNGCIAWYRRDDNLLVADAHEGNVIRTAEGVLFAIDLNLIQPEGEMKDSVLLMISRNF